MALAISRPVPGRALFQPVILQQSNHRQDQNEGGKRSAIHELFAKGFQQHTEIHANQQARRQPRHHDNQQRVETQCKTNNHHRNPDKWQQCRTVHKRYPIQSERGAPTAIFYTSQQSEAGALRRAMLCFASGSTEPALKSYI